MERKFKQYDVIRLSYIEPEKAIPYMVLGTGYIDIKNERKPIIFISDGNRSGFNYETHYELVHKSGSKKSNEFKKHFPTF